MPPTPRPRVTGAFAFVAVIALSACGGGIDKDDTFIDVQTTGLLDIEGGECFSDPQYSAAAGEEVVLYMPCEEGSDNQSYHFVRAPDGPWDREKVADLGWQGCGDNFAERWTSQEESGLDFYPILPTALTWADGDRVIMCAVYDPDGRLPDAVVPLR